MDRTLEAELRLAEIVTILSLAIDFGIGAQPLEFETVGSPSNVRDANKKPGIGCISGLLKPPPLLFTKSTLSNDDGELPSQVANGPSMAAPRCRLALIVM